MDYRIFSRNLKFLLKKNKEINHLKKSDFLKYIGVSYQAVKKWESGGNIKQKNLEWVVAYFIKKLHINISVKDILEINLEKNYDIFKVSIEQIERRKEVIEIYSKLDIEIQKELLELLKKIK